MSCNLAQQLIMPLSLLLPNTLLPESQLKSILLQLHILDRHHVL